MKEKTTWDIEAFNAGSKEIERKRELIRRIVMWLIRQIGNTSRGTFGKKWKKGTTIARVELTAGEYFSVVADFKPIGTETQAVLPYLGKNRLEDLSSISHRLVPVLYQKLPELIEAADSFVPDAGIWEKFNFFCENSPQQ